MSELKIGDVVISTAGRDKNRVYLVIGIGEDKIVLVNGRNVRAEKPKVKNFKHIIKATETNLGELALRILRGEPVGKERIFRDLRFAAENKKDGTI